MEIRILIELVQRFAPRESFDKETKQFLVFFPLR